MKFFADIGWNNLCYKLSAQDLSAAIRCDWNVILMSYAHMPSNPGSNLCPTLYVRANRIHNGKTFYRGWMLWIVTLNVLQMTSATLRLTFTGTLTVLCWGSQFWCSDEAPAGVFQGRNEAVKGQLLSQGPPWLTGLRSHGHDVITR